MGKGLLRRQAFILNLAPYSAKPIQSHKNDTMPDCILTDLETLREMFLREARIYAKQGAVPDGARPHQITPWQLACGYMAGDYRIAAHEVQKILKKHKKNAIGDSQSPGN